MIALSTSYKAQLALQDHDLTKQGSVTPGKKGPETDSEGKIYAVNFEEQGTIGKVMRNGEASVFVKQPNGNIGNGIRFGEKFECLWQLIPILIFWKLI